MTAWRFPRGDGGSPLVRALRRTAAVLVWTFDQIENILVYVTGTALCFLVFAITYDVFGRRWFGVSAAWVLEFSEYYLLFATFMAAPWILRQGGHASIDLIYTRLGPLAAKVLRTIALSIGLCACIFGLWFSSDIVVTNFQRGSLTGIIYPFPVWLILLPVPWGFGMLILELVRQIYRIHRE